MTVDSRDFRVALGYFATGVTVVTTKLNDEIRGLTVNSFCSVSLDPPLVLVCIDRSAKSYQMMTESGIFAVNILSCDMEDISKIFAEHDTQSTRFGGTVWKKELTGAPILEGTIAFLDCRVVARHQAGDHDIFIGRVEKLGVGTDGDPLIYHRSKYKKLR